MKQSNHLDDVNKVIINFRSLLEKYPIKNKPGHFYEYRMDMNTIQSYEMKDFMEALSYIGVLPE